MTRSYPFLFGGIHVGRFLVQTSYNSNNDSFTDACYYSIDAVGGDANGAYVYSIGYVGT